MEELSVRASERVDLSKRGVVSPGSTERERRRARESV